MTDYAEDIIERYPQFTWDEPEMIDKCNGDEREFTYTQTQKFVSEYLYDNDEQTGMLL